MLGMDFKDFKSDSENRLKMAEPISQKFTKFLQKLNLKIKNANSRSTSRSGIYAPGAVQHAQWIRLPNGRIDLFKRCLLFSRRSPICVNYFCISVIAFRFSSESLSFETLNF